LIVIASTEFTLSTPKGSDPGNTEDGLPGGYSSQ
jgi:hypothetical protein